MKKDLVELGSQTAKNGFKNEDDVIDKFNNWKNDSVSKDWLEAMGYKLNEIEYVKAVKAPAGFKTDVQVQIIVSIKLKEITDIQNIQVKLVSNKKGFNQIDKRWVDKYVEMWSLPKQITKILKLYTGELKPYKNDVRDKRRMFIDEMSQEEQNLIVDFLSRNKTLIISDIIKGRGKLATEWMLVIRKVKIEDWVLKPINIVLNHYSSGDVEITKLGNIKIGKITMQRKGGDGGRDSAKMLQFKIDPTELFNLE